MTQTIIEQRKYETGGRMIAGVKVKCLVSRVPHFAAGLEYEIAEILEYPDHVMVRKPDGRWPKPGDPYFAWHPNEFFESPPSGIPALSCGYLHEDMEFFGTIIPSSILPTPRKWDPTKRSTELAREKCSDVVDGVGIRGLWWLTYFDVLPKVCFPDSLEKSFLILGVDYRPLWWRFTTKRTVTRAIRKIMKQLGIPSRSMPPVEDQWIEFWRRSWRKPGALTWKSPKLADSFTRKMV